MCAPAGRIKLMVVLAQNDVPARRLSVAVRQPATALTEVAQTHTDALKKRMLASPFVPPLQLVVFVVPSHCLAILVSLIFL